MLVVFCISCKSKSDKYNNASDTTKVEINDPNAVMNDVPMRTTDTSMNLMKDTMGVKPK